MSKGAPALWDKNTKQVLLFIGNVTVIETVLNRKGREKEIKPDFCC
jgi:hypothetical protein